MTDPAPALDHASTRVRLRDDAGQELLSYLPGTRDGHAWADQAQLIEQADPALAAAEVMRQLRDWIVSAAPPFGRELIGRGATPKRHGYTMLLGLALPAGPDASPASPPPGYRFVPCDRPADDLRPAAEAAFPPGHPDHEPGFDPEPDGEGEIEHLLDGTLMGPLLPCSLLAVDELDSVVAGCLVNDWQPVPWITLMFRDPGRSPAGMGAALLSAVVAGARRDGVHGLGLAVTHGNPARTVYARAGFTVTSESFSVLIPA